MGLESATYINELVETNPVASTDKAYTLADHHHQTKGAIKNTFPNIAGAVTPTHTELNYVDGVTSAIQTQLDEKLATASLLSTLLTQDGADSNLDADLLDGKQGADYALTSDVKFLGWAIKTADTLVSPGTSWATVDSVSITKASGTSYLVAFLQATMTATTPTTGFQLAQLGVNLDGSGDVVLSGNAVTDGSSAFRNSLSGFNVFTGAAAGGRTINMLGVCPAGLAVYNRQLLVFEVEA